MHTLRWYKEQGGVAAMYKLNLEKAAILYDEIDRNSAVYLRNIQMKKIVPS